MMKGGRHDYDWSGFGEVFSSDAWNDYAGRYRYLMRYWPVVGGMIQGYDSMKDWDSYLRSHNMSWSDVEHWSKMGGSGFSGTFSGAYQVSKNLLSLYK